MDDDKGIIGRLWIVAVGIAVSLRWIVARLACVTVVPVFVLASLLVLGVLGILEWILSGRKRCWALADRLNDWGHRHVPEL